MVAGALVVATTALGCREREPPPIVKTPTWARHTSCNEGGDCARRCEAGEAAVCLEAARHVRDGDGVARDLARADRMLITGCGLGSGGACLERADSIDAKTAGAQVAALRQRGIDLLRAGCDASNVDDCRSLVRAHALGLGPAGRKDPDSARALSERILPIYEGICDQGDASACRSAGWLARHRHGEPTPEALRRALPLFEKACAIDPVDCWVLGETKEKLGLVGRPDLLRGCDADPDGRSCFDPASPDDIELARKKAGKLDQRCRKGVRRACMALATFDDSPLGIKVRDEAARSAHRVREAKLLRGECDAGAGDSCMLLATRLADDQCVADQRGELAALYAKACDAGDERGCSHARP